MYGNMYTSDNILLMPIKSHVWFYSFNYMLTHPQMSMTRAPPTLLAVHVTPPPSSSSVSSRPRPRPHTSRHLTSAAWGLTLKLTPRARRPSVLTPITRWRPSPTSQQKCQRCVTTWTKWTRRTKMLNVPALTVS